MTRDRNYLLRCHTPACEPLRPLSIKKKKKIWLYEKEEILQNQITMFRKWSTVIRMKINLSVFTSTGYG